LVAAEAERGLLDFSEFCSHCIFSLMRQPFGKNPNGKCYEQGNAKYLKQHILAPFKQFVLLEY
jgi:hypothetical protein